jgi:acetyl-CoA acetyltransferase
VFDACIAGVGTSREFGFNLGKSPMLLQIEAFASALADAGLTKDDIDGVVTCHGAPSGVDYDEFIVAAGLDTGWASQKWSHGRWAATTIIEAALALDAGLATCIAVVDTTSTARGYRKAFGRLGGGSAKEGLRDMGGGHGEWDIHGLDTPGAATALVAKRYMDKYGATELDLAAVALTFRKHAELNPMAIMRNKPMALADYLAEPVIAAPFRRADYCLGNDGACCLILTSAHRAREPVRIVGAEGLRTSRDDYVLFSRPGLGMGVEREYALDTASLPRLYERAGVRPDDVDGLYVYDSFGSNLWMVLERFRFCKEGEAPAFVTDAGITLDAALPVNTNGGLMSEAHLSGYGHIIEMVRQLRGTAGERQIDGARLLQWATPRGDSLLLAKAGVME